MRPFRFSHDKLLTLDEALTYRNECRRVPLTVGITNGAFDLIHAGHVDHLEQCRQHCDVLFVLLNNDASIKRNKGEHRPVLDTAARARVLCALECVDVVITFGEDTAREKVRQLHPDVYVKDEPYRGKLPEGEVVARVAFTQGRIESTTDIIKRCVEIRKAENEA